MENKEIKIPSRFALMKNERPYWYGRYSWKANWALTTFALTFILLRFVIPMLR
ncbi:MAG: hypothetical protein ACP5GU_02220 [Thermoprotei archaeon]|jgi:hypothetical protein